jgi:hypothetical protein
MKRALLLAVGAAVLAGCAHQKIPGTEIEDSSDTRAIIDVMQSYRKAVEARDVQAIVALADPTFKDDGGSSSPDDDLDYATLAPKLTERFAKLDSVRLDLDIQRIKIQDNVAAAIYHYDTRFVVLSPLNKVQKADSDIKQMAFKRVGKDWKITSGI